ncbi:hypothetical protein XENOCAPTIV_015744 [Xenoophorus captivus]|uniref:Uncharacterized protein n=1 Tax=Xenoophorus captivus TaxID=1517983 RepID=A0ABV0R1Q5_9TELE
MLQLKPEPSLISLQMDAAAAFSAAQWEFLQEAPQRGVGLGRAISSSTSTDSLCVLSIICLSRLLMLICAWRGVPFQTAVPGEQNERNLMMNRILLPSISAPEESKGGEDVPRVALKREQSGLELEARSQVCRHTKADDDESVKD